MPRGIVERQAAEDLQLAVGEVQVADLDDVGVAPCAWTITIRADASLRTRSRRTSCSTRVARCGLRADGRLLAPQQLREPRLPGVAGGRLRRRRQVLPPGALERRADRRGARLRARARGARDAGRGAAAFAAAFDGFRVAVYPRRGGRTPELDDPKTLEWIGRFIGRIHAVGATKKFKHRETLNQQDLRPRAARLAARRTTSSRPICSTPGRRSPSRRSPLVDACYLELALQERSGCTATAIRATSSGPRTGRTSSTSTTRAWGRRCRTCGCCSRATARR